MIYLAHLNKTNIKEEKAHAEEKFLSFIDLLRRITTYREQYMNFTVTKLLVYLIQKLSCFFPPQVSRKPSETKDISAFVAYRRLLVNFII